MTIKKFHAGILCFLLSLATILCAEVIYSENFDGIKNGTPLSELNWNVKSSENQSLYRIEDGVLKITCLNNPYNGGFAEKDIPLVKKGTLDFDANIAMDGVGNARGIALAMGVYNVSTWFHDYCGDWRRYFPEPPSKRIEGFSIEPVGHRVLTKVDKGKWNHYRIVFDADAGIVEYYCNDMVDPVHVDADVPVLGRAEYMGRHLSFASIGFVNGPVTYGIDNIALAAADDSAVETPAEKGNSILVFQGISSNEYRAGLELEKLENYSIREYWAESILSEIPVNKFRMGRLPGRTTLDKSRAIVFVDLPLGPDCVPDYFVKRLEEWVKNGGVLITLGGPFSYGKGQYKGTLLEAILPVNISGLWEVKRASSPLIIRPEKGFEKLSEQISKDNPAVYYYHDLTMKDGAEVLVNSGQNIPLWVYRDYGKGRVVSFTGTAMGKTYGKTVLISEWKEWGEFLREVVQWSLSE
ncbi:MAG: hypothetical protein JW957_03175 [Candidatus Omnitrophica bacterium]|nr:hypothetical protein [Candidatus Omnitrophota bacterium]